MVGVVGMLVALFAGVATYARIAVDAERVRLAADHAALAGASVVLGAARLPAGDACAAAGHSARLNDATLASCTELSTGVQVTARRASALGHEVTATARAGAPEDHSARQTSAPPSPVSGPHPTGRQPDSAALEATRVVVRRVGEDALEQREGAGLVER